MIKDILRTRVKNMRKSMTHDEVEEKSALICKRLFDSGILDDTKTVMVYFDAFNEVCTRDIISGLFEQGKRLAAPVTDKTTNTLTAYYFTPEDTLIKGAYNITEPPRTSKADFSEIDAIIIPGIAFDRHGNRMGFGAGYYDRFLENFHGKKIGICYKYQCKYDVPVSEHDIPMDYVINEEEIYVI